MTEKAFYLDRFESLSPSERVTRILNRISTAEPGRGDILVFTIDNYTEVFNGVEHKGGGIRSAFHKTVKNDWSKFKGYKRVGVFNRQFNPHSVKRILRHIAELPHEYK